jgi:hypothetical protein
MIEAFLCGYNFFCHVDSVRERMYNSKYPKDVAQLCYYFEDQKVKLPDYCFYQSQVQPPRRRSEF